MSIASEVPRAPGEAGIPRPIGPSDISIKAGKTHEFVATGDDEDADDEDADRGWLGGSVVIEINERDKRGRKRLIRLAPLRERVHREVVKARLRSDPKTARKERERLAMDAVAVRVRERRDG